MYSRFLEPPRNKSFFLFGPRGTGKSSWIQARFSDALVFDLLEAATYQELLARPEQLDVRIPKTFRNWIVIDEVQRIPSLLNEVHRLIEKRKLRFALTGSSARSLRRRGVNLLAGRALTLQMHPLTSSELGADFSIGHSLKYGQLPAAYVEDDPKAYLESYVATYLREEVQQEGLTRNLAAFSRFLQAASFSQASVLNIAAVARDCAIERKVVEGYFSILEDLMLAVRLPPFIKRARRRVVAHPKFYFFDVGVYRTLRPKGPLDPVDELEGAALETLLFQELRAHNATGKHGYTLHYWRSATGHEVDFVLYGEKGLIAFEVKRAGRVRSDDLKSIRLFCEDYPMARGFVVYTGTRTYSEGPVHILPITTCLTQLDQLLAG